MSQTILDSMLPWHRAETDRVRLLVQKNAWQVIVTG
jgi:hypothetical protein